MKLLPPSASTVAGKKADPYIRGHGSTAYSVLRYELELDVRLASNLLQGRATLMARALIPLTTVELDLVALRMDKATVNGERVVRHAHRGGKLRLTLPAPVDAGQEFSMEIRYGGNPAPATGRWGEVGWEELDDGVLVAGQPTGAPTWFPCNDRPSNKASYRITVTTDADYTVVCNGLMVSHTRKSSRETWVYEQSGPMATYLATIQIGRYKLFSLPASDASKQIPVRIAVPKRLQSQAASALSRQREMVETFVSHFGPYPFHAYTVVVTDDELEIPLEAQSLSIIGRNHLQQDWEAQRLIAHELSHQWFGNSLTLSKWCDIWLHEGFACFSEWVWSEDSGSMTIAERAAGAHAKLSSEPQNLVVGDPGPAMMFDDRVYKRGALALEALRRRLGNKQFFALLREWVARYRHNSVATSDFVALIDEFYAESEGFCAKEFLEPWLYESALPMLPDTSLVEV